MQNEARRLRSLPRTKVVAVGIGNAANQSELRAIATEPYGRNVIRVQNFNSLNDTEDQLRDASCSGWLPSCNISNNLRDSVTNCVCLLAFCVRGN